MRGAAHYPGMPLRCTRIHPFLCALALLVAGVGTIPAARAASLPSGIRVQPISASLQGRGRIAVYGSAAAGCLPAVGRVTLDGADIDIELKASETGCNERRPVPFHLTIDPAAAAGLEALPANVYRVRVYARAGSNDQLVAFSLVDAAPAATAPVPESGFWWTESSDDGQASASVGSGMNIELQDNQMAVSLLGFTETGAPTWYFGSTTLSGSVARIPLVQLGGGDGWFSPLGSRPEAEAGPRLEIDFESPMSARAYLVRSGDDGSDAQVRTLKFSRSSFSSGAPGTAWAGRWVLVPEDGGNPRLFDFSAPGSRDAENFHLADAASDASLDCRLAAGAANPETCTLSAAAALVADFDEVGLDRLGGHDANGLPVQLVRVPR